jgi:hypothetical protein
MAEYKKYIARFTTQRPEVPTKILLYTLYTFMLKTAGTDASRHKSDPKINKENIVSAGWVPPRRKRENHWRKAERHCSLGLSTKEYRSNSQCCRETGHRANGIFVFIIASMAPHLHPLFFLLLLLSWAFSCETRIKAEG